MLCVSLTSRIGEHQSRNAASNQGQAREASTGQDTKLTEQQHTHAFTSYKNSTKRVNPTNISQLAHGLYLSGVFLFVLEQAGGKNRCTDPGFGYVVAQLRHTEDARLHQTPATQGEKRRPSLDHHRQPRFSVETGRGVTNLSFSDSSAFLTVGWGVWRVKEKGETCTRRLI